MKKRILAIVLSIALLLPTMASLVVFAETLPGPYTASEGFSSTQGQNQWYYQSYLISTSTYYNLIYSSPGSKWIVSVYTPTLYVKSDSMFPDTPFDAVRKWVAPSSGEVRITGNVKKGEVGGDGVVARVVKNGTVIWGPQAIAYNDTTGYDINVDTTITQNDAVYFIVNKGTSTTTNDKVIWDPTITYLPAVEWSESRYQFVDNYIMNLEDGTTPEMFMDNLDGLIRDDATIEILDPNNNNMLDPNYDESYEYIGTGFTVNVLLNNQVDESYTVVYRGDCTNDGYIDSGDIVIMRRHILGIAALTGEYLLAADADKDSNIDGEDVAMVTQYIQTSSAINQEPLPVNWILSRYNFLDETYLANLEMETTPQMFMDNLDGLMMDNVSIEILDPDNENMLDPNYSDSYEFIGTGFTVKVYVDSTLYETFITVLYGDCSRDGYIDGADLLNITRHISQTESLTGIDLVAGNADKDVFGDVDVDDYTKVYNYILGLDTIDQTPLQVDWVQSRYLFKNDTNLMNLEMETTPQMFMDNLDGIRLDTAIIEILDPNDNDMLDPYYDDSYEFLGTGFIVNVYEGSTLMESYPIIYRGDCTQDGYIDSGDIVIMRRHILNIEPLTGIYFTAADVDKDNDVDDDDVDIVTDFISGLTTIDQTP